LGAFPGYDFPFLSLAPGCFRGRESRPDRHSSRTRRSRLICDRVKGKEKGSPAPDLPAIGNVRAAVFRSLESSPSVGQHTPRGLRAAGRSLLGVPVDGAILRGELIQKPLVVKGWLPTNNTSGPGGMNMAGGLR